MTDFIAFTVVGIVTGGIYAVAASGLVVTYTTSGIFNFAHGAMGMFMAFVYWELSVDQGWPTWLALIVVLFVITPIFGAVVERTLMRRLHGSSTGVSLVVTLGLLVLLLGISQEIWPGTEARTLPSFFPGESITIADVVVTYHQLTVIAVAILTAVFLRLLLFRTRVGIAMRAVVDDRELSAMNGALPERASQLSWALGAVLAALAGILVAPALTLEHLGLTLLVVNGYAAAMLGRLRSLPLTFVGALVLGLADAYVIGYGSDVTLVGSLKVGDLKPILPTIFLFGILVFLPQARLRVGRLVGARTPRVPGLRESGLAAGAFVAVAVVASPFLSEFWLYNIGSALALGLVMLSLVLLTGYAGQVSLMQMSFVGAGALMMGRLGDGGSVLGVLAAVLLAGVLGAVVALPALRLQDLYLALATLALALVASWAFNQEWSFNGILAVDRLRLPGLSFRSEQSQVMLLAVVFAAMGMLVLAIRRGPFGRRLAAMSDSPAACATLGLNLVATKTIVFALSAAMAGLAGVLFGGLRTTVTPNDFLMLQSLFVFLLAMFGGITTVTGALVGGSILALLPVIQDEFLPDVQQGALQGLFIGAGAILISRYPNGFAGFLTLLKERLTGAPRIGPRAARSQLGEPPVTEREPELVGS